MVRSAAYYLTVADAINYSMSGHHVWDNQDPTTLELGDGRTMQFSKHAMEPVHWLTKPAQQALNKLGPTPGEILEQVMGKEYLSASGKSPPMKSRLGHVAKRVLPIWAQQGADEATLASAMGFPIYGKTEEQKADEQMQKLLDSLEAQ